MNQYQSPFANNLIHTDVTEKYHFIKDQSTSIYRLKTLVFRNQEMHTRERERGCNTFNMNIANKQE